MLPNPTAVNYGFIPIQRQPIFLFVEAGKELTRPCHSQERHHLSTEMESGERTDVLETYCD
jgi:hypothetical protein